MTKKLEELEELNRLATKIDAQREQAAKEIREGFCDRAIVFLDVVGSTAFKGEHQDTPDVWILRVKQFSEVLAKAVEQQNGQVVKYIGDEVMASFENAYDAASLVGRVDEIEESLEKATGFPTRIKVAADFGSVYELTFPKHTAKDPQGSPVDRCARIAKHGKEGEVLASTSFKEKTDKLLWYPLGQIEMKGLGVQQVWQLARSTVKLTELVQVPKTRWEALLEAERALGEAREKNARLAAQLEARGDEPDPELLVDDKDAEDSFFEFGELLEALQQTLKRVPSAVTEILFQETRGNEPHFNDVEGDLTRAAEDGWIEVDRDTGHVASRDEHPKMRKVQAALDSLVEWMDAVPEGFEEWHFDTFGVEGNVRLRPFWSQHLSLPR